MLNSIKVSLKDTLIYGLGNIAVKIVGLLLIPLFSNPKFFTIEEFGVLGILEISALVLTALMASALPQSLTRWFWDKEHKDNQKGIFFMSFATQLIVSLSLCALLIPLSKTFSIMIFSKPDWSRVITFVIIGSGIQALNNINNTLMRLQSKSVLYTTTNLFKLTFVLFLSLYFIISRKMGLEGYYLAQAIGNALLVIILSGYTLKNSRIFFSRSIFQSMNAYGFPLFLANISAVALNVVDRYSLNSLAALKSVALYTLAFKITSVLKLAIVDSMKLSLAPMMLKRIGSPDIQRFYSKVLLYSSYVLMFAVIGVSLFSFELIKVIAKSKQFWDAVTIIPVLSMSVVFVNMKDLTVYGLHVVKKSRIIGIIVVFSTILSVCLNLLLIPVWDIMGAAVATLLAQFVFWLITYYYSQKAFYVPYEIRKIFTLVFVGAILSSSCLLLNKMEIIPRLLIKTGLLVSFPFILYLLKFYEAVELQAIRGFTSKWSNLKNLKDNLKSLRGLTDDE
jgi:O-antigen/teichoic acid export membrane protein